LPLPRLPEANRERFAEQARITTDQIKEITGSSHEFRRAGDEGTTIIYRFCADFGSTVYCPMNDKEGVATIPVDALADLAFPPSTRSV